MDLIRSIRDQEQCQKDMQEQEAQKIEMEEESVTDADGRTRYAHFK